MGRVASLGGWLFSCGKGVPSAFAKNLFSVCRTAMSPALAWAMFASAASRVARFNSTRAMSPLAKPCVDNTENLAIKATRSRPKALRSIPR